MMVRPSPALARNSDGSKLSSRDSFIHRPLLQKPNLLASECKHQHSRRKSARPPGWPSTSSTKRTNGGRNVLRFRSACILHLVELGNARISNLMQALLNSN